MTTKSLENTHRLIHQSNRRKTILDHKQRAFFLGKIEDWICLMYWHMNNTSVSCFTKMVQSAILNPLEPKDIFLTISNSWPVE